MIEIESLNSLFYPKEVAVIGATSSPGKTGNIILKRLMTSRIKIYPVHPKADVLEGIQVINDIEKLPDNLDLAVITIGALGAVEAAERCAKKGTRVIIIVASGFGETGEEGRALETRLAEIPYNYGARILGPNTLGVFMPESGIDTIFVEHGDRALAAGGGVAFLTQSGSVGAEALGYAANIGFGMRVFVGLGNKIDLDELDFLKYFGRDRKTKSIAVYVESIEKGGEFLKEAQIISRKKPVIVLKAGRTAAGQSAVSSHTGKLAGSDRVIDGAFRQHGILRVLDDEELSDAAKVLSMSSLPEGNRVAVLTAAGGYGVMCADYIEERGRGEALVMAELSDWTSRRLVETNVGYASSKNPVDITAGADSDNYLASLKILLEDDGVDLVICVAFFAPVKISDDLVLGIAEIAGEYSKPVLVFSAYGPYTDSYLKRFYNEGIPGFPSIARTVRAARFLVERKNILENLRGAE
ncbi:MAG: CoA-binding protein [Spirochaetales bacterium]|uniref:CoA-binding protein n=1 Tax=Candidatus Thalassospirochaeta sargassi TaxID=3119039 RepID=A0AAJ1IIC5_9SPIO|nr:CoA-binding protein [Spirochaetales bacterium]